MPRSRFTLLVTLAVIVFFYLPIVMLVITSFNASRFGGEWSGFSLKWYEQLFYEHNLWHALRNSLLIGVSATTISTVIGTMAALALYQYKTKLQKLHYILIYTPLILPDILMGISLLLFFVTVHLQLGLLTVFIAHTTFCLSYVTMVVLAKLQNFEFSLIEAAQDLGANWWEVLCKVLLPLLAPGIVSGALLAFTLSIDDFVITYFVAGPGAHTLPIYVYGMIKFGSTAVINALSVVLLLITFVIIWFSQRLIEER